MQMTRIHWLAVVIVVAIVLIVVRLHVAGGGL